ncbi:hypothetical protein MNBD_IGNAVI01-1616 [hydrothermal vent metagenome]|uniref:Alginate export domain-containing protein n=1 Tax=hydrothermal vent metagenome TaxID=652676 RepID=A0A3B1CXP6_9ZZZZ
MRIQLFLFLLITFLASSLLTAQDKIKVNAQIRPRFNFNDKDFNNSTGGNSYTELRSRLGVAFSASKSLSGFVQIQDSRLFGSEPHTLADTKNLDLHQAYFNIKRIFKLPFDLQVGRMELSYGSQRLIGAVGWHNVGRSFDGGVLKLITKSINVDFIAARTNESGLSNDTLDSFLYSAYGHLKVVKDYEIQPFIIGETRVHDNFNRYTVGLYIGNGVKVGFSHELDASYQFGTQMKDVNIAAYMAAYNLKFIFNTKIKPMIGAGIDYLSGDDGEDATKYKVFSTLYATNHKFYGYMDYFLNIPRHTYGKGLIDIQGKASIVPFAKFIIMAAYHMFKSSADYTLISGDTSTNFGSEIDITLAYGYSKLIKFVGGFSYFTPGEIFKETKGEDSSNWTYVMAIVNL